MYFTNYAENQLADFTRGVELVLPAEWRIALLGPADSDGSFTELDGIGYARQSIARSLANFAGTQAPGSVLASTGTSQATSNNVALDYGTAGSAWGTAYNVGFFEEDSDDNCWIILPLPSPLVIGNGDPVAIAAGVISMTLGLTGGVSNYLANKLIDLIFRGEVYTWPASTYIGYSITAPTNASPGTEPLGGYARVEVVTDTDEWTSTQGNTDPVSTGEGGEVANATQILFPLATADQGAVSHRMQFDAPTLGNLLFWAPMTVGGVPTPYTVNRGNQPRFEPGDLINRIA